MNIRMIRNGIVGVFFSARCIGVSKFVDFDGKIAFLALFTGFRWFICIQYAREPRGE